MADGIVLETATEANRVVLTYDRKDFSDVTGHTGVLIATEDTRPRDLRNAVERVSAAYPSLDDVVEYCPIGLDAGIESTERVARDSELLVSTCPLG